jgi:ABC-2 type transport system ATP-binding protein
MQSNLILAEIIHKLRQLNKTVIISSHIFSTLSESCDEIHLMRKGEHIKAVVKEEFKDLEDEMKAFTLGNIIEKLDLY